MTMISDNRPESFPGGKEAAADKIGDAMRDGNKI